MESNFKEFQYSAMQAIQSQLKKSWTTQNQGENYYGLRVGLCVDTKDPFAQGRVRYYLPGMVNKQATLEQLPWAWPISVLGGFDDSGALWVPPAGSAIALLFEVGSRYSAFYIGTVWNRDRSAPPHDWGYQVPEFDCIHAGHRKGYWVGPNDESQVLPPNNTYNSNIKDFDDLKAFEQDTNALKKITPSHLHELKTPQKHHLVMDDGNYYCNQKWKHLKLGSGNGNTLLMWDDHLHAAGQQANPKACSCGPNASGGTGSGIKCGDGGSDPTACRSESPTNCKTDSATCLNNLFKHESEARPWRGPCTPQNNKCQLQQTGIFMSSISGHVLVQDDEVEQPTGIPNWERGTSPFDWGCTNKFFGKTFLQSATGHVIKMGDAEDNPMIRSGTFTHPVTGKYEPNGILMLTATGNRVELNDHTLSDGTTAGRNRGIILRSTSNHFLEMCDNQNKQASPPRKDGGTPEPAAAMAYVQLRSGYGLSLLMRDDHSQQKTQQQFIELLSPHKDNCHGPHILRMQENFPDQPGLVFLRAGGYFFGVSLKEWVEIVGVPDSCAKKASKVTVVSQHDINITKEVYFEKNKLEFHLVDEIIVLGAGLDCPEPDGTLGPCIYPVIVARCPWACPWTGFIHWGIKSMSDRVFGSASQCK
jgi:hypothetical protein